LPSMGKRPGIVSGFEDNPFSGGGGRANERRGERKAGGQAGFIEDQLLKEQSLGGGKMKTHVQVEKTVRGQINRVPSTIF